MSVDVTGGIPRSLQGTITDGAEEERRGGTLERMWDKYSNTDQIPEELLAIKKRSNNLIINQTVI